MACTSSIALFASGILISPLHHLLQVSTATDGLESSGCLLASSSAVRSALSSPHSATVRLSDDSRSERSAERQGLSLVNSMEHPRERRWRRTNTARFPE